MNDPYAQCILTKGTKKTTSWLPMKFAKTGKVLKLKDDGTWDDGWTVTEVGTIQDFSYVKEKERDFTKQREASDI